MRFCHSLASLILVEMLTVIMAFSGESASGSTRALSSSDTRQAVISFAGDCTLGSMNKSTYGRGFVATIEEKGLSHPFSGVLDIFAADDLTLVNLEGTFTNSKKAQDKAFVFSGPPSYAEILRLGSVEAVNTANNHIMDYGKQGKDDTLAALDSFGIKHFGEGELAIYNVNGIRLGMTGYSYPHRKTLKNLEERDIPLLRAAGCDIIILSIHAGTEEQYRPTGTQTQIARGAIDLGVDIVVGHHPHVVQAVEVYKGKPIFYSLGNFAFGGNINPKDWNSLIGQVVIERDENGARPVEMRLIPCVISNAEKYSDFRPVPVPIAGEQAASLFKKMMRYGKNINSEIYETGVLSLRNEWVPQKQDAVALKK